MSFSFIFDVFNLECFPMEVSRPGWKFHVHIFLHSVSKLTYFSSIFLDPLSHPSTLSSSLVDHGREAETNVSPHFVQCHWAPLA